ncbi:MAG: GGDEF domain-containing protein, partial [Kiritimatiellaceae bacterium]|nr:GGDEF domain-containing protein [Kiritimatiellaceae bacterium]
FDESLHQNIEMARRYSRELSLVLFDLDRLKQINDAQGHEAGDTALKTFADMLKKTARAADLVCRIGGDEFAVILPETDLSKVCKFTDRFFQTLKSTESELGVSASVGVAALPSDNLFASADAELLAAKRRRENSI